MGILATSTELWLAVAGIAAWMVYMCLRAITVETWFCTACHSLKVDARNLRQQQLKRLRELRIRQMRDLNEEINRAGITGRKLTELASGADEAVLEVHPVDDPRSVAQAKAA
jgi:hypothetical protein